MAAPLVSVVIPGYNIARHIVSTLESVFSQTYPNYEVVVIDDGSTDSTPAVLDAYRDRIVSRRTPNGGLAAARNAGMQLARGEYIAWLDADDLCEPERLQVQAAFLAANPDIVAVSSGFAAFDDARGVFDADHGAQYYSQVRRHGLAGLFPERQSFDGSGLDWLARGSLGRAYSVYRGMVWERLLLGNFMHPPTLMLRREARQRAGWLRLGIRTAEDWDYILRLASLGPVALIDAPLLRYRCHPGQMSGDENLATNAVSCLQLLRWQVDENPERVQGMEPQLKAAFARLHTEAAYALAENRRLAALRHLFQAIRFDVHEANFARNFARILVGHAGLEILRSVRALHHA